MSLLSFIKDKKYYILSTLFLIISLEILLLTASIDSFIRLYVCIIPLLLLFICLFIEYYQKNKYFKRTLKLLEELDQKYLLPEVIEQSNFSESHVIYDIVQELSKSMHEYVNIYKYNMEDYKDYIELWIHEIKLPLTSLQLIVENNHLEDLTQDELNKIENYINQALYYARSNSVDKDYLVKEINLQSLINECIKINKRYLMNKVKLNIHDLNYTVYSDSKWLVFIINQILTNSLQYFKDDPTLSIYAKENKENIILYIEDNGIGIKEEELDYVFNKGYTGSNGRNNKKSTGIGLYLCKKLCLKLGLDITIHSIYQKGTTISIIFPKNSYTEVR